MVYNEQMRLWYIILMWRKFIVEHTYATYA